MLIKPQYFTVRDEVPRRQMLKWRRLFWWSLLLWLALPIYVLGRR